MDFLDKLYSSNYFGIGLFAVISVLVVLFLIVLFFGKKDAKKRKIEETQNISTDAFKETSTKTPVEIPSQLEPVAPINLEQTVEPTVLEPVSPLPIHDVEPLKPVEPIKENDDFIDNLTVEEPIKPIELPKVEPIIPEVPKKEVDPIKVEPVKIEIPEEKPVSPIIKEEEPALQLNDEPIIDTYYKPVEKEPTEPVKVPNIDFDALAKSISKELDDLESSSKKYDEIKVTPINEITKPEVEKKPQTFSSVYVNEPPKVVPKEKIELPKKIELPARKSE